MYPVRQITGAPYQRSSVVLADGSAVALTLRYRPNQFGWFLDELAWQGFTVHSVRIVTSPNLLHQFRNQIPFGLACFTKGNREPIFSQDFASGAASLNILTPAEVAQYQTYLATGQTS